MAPSERHPARRSRAAAVLDALERAYPGVKIELDFTTDLELLVAVILSAQCTDVRVNLVTPALFRSFPTAADYARAEPEELHPFIQSCGLFRNKARAIVLACRSIVQRHAGAVPRSREALRALPGVGPKTAGVVTIHLSGGEPAFPVDTHVGRLARRLGFSRELDPDRVERDLARLWPPERWALGHQLLVRHGRRRCGARAPDCEGCPLGPNVAALCPRRGVGAQLRSPTVPEKSRL